MIKAEYEKEAPKGTFTIEIKVDGVDAPFVLKVVDLTADQTLPEADRQVYASTPQLAGPSVGVGPGVAPGGTGETCTLEVQIPWIGANRNSTPTTMPIAAATKVARSPSVRTRTHAT